MDEHPAKALVRKKRSSIVVATELVRDGKADAVVTAGHTGAGMAAGVLILGTLPGIDRPALAVQVPGGEPPLLLLDIGANPDSTSENLAQYARMGALFSEHVVGVRRPRVALLSIGEERGKGDTRVKEATELIGATDLNFVGNVEGKDLTADMADVVVCDAMLGNVVIKFFEGLSGFIFDQLRGPSSGGTLRGRVAYLLLRPGIAPDPQDVRLRDRRRVAAAGRQGGGDHHPRPGQAADDRARRPRGRHDRARARAGADRRGPRRRRRSRGPGRAAVGRDRRRARPRAGRLLMPALSVGPGVIRDTVRLAALEVPGVLRVGRGGPAWRDALGGNPVHVRVRDGRVHVTVWLVARPRQRLVPLTAQVRAAVAGAVERLLGMELGGVTVLVDGVGA